MIVGRAPDMLLDCTRMEANIHLPFTRRSSLPTGEPATKLDGKARREHRVALNYPWDSLPEYSRLEGKTKFAKLCDGSQKFGKLQFRTVRIQESLPAQIMTNFLHRKYSVFLESRTLTFVHEFFEAKCFFPRIYLSNCRSVYCVRHQLHCAVNECMSFSAGRFEALDQPHILYP